MASGATLSILHYYIVLNSAFLFLVLTVKFGYFSTAQIEPSDLYHPQN
jgi:hypothetical protein